MKDGDYVGKLCPRCGSPNSIPVQEILYHGPGRERYACGHIYNPALQPWKDIRTGENAMTLPTPKPKKRDNRRDQLEFEEFK